jgi:hypothetical protein
MTRRKTKFGPTGPDVDLDTEEVTLANGQRLTNGLAAEIAERAVAQRRGRPSLSAGSEHTPNLTLRVPAHTRVALEAIAVAHGRRLADIGREALDEYVARHAG